MIVLTREQRVALKRVYDRGCDTDKTYRQYRKEVQYHYSGDCIMVWWHSMWLGIERDGYTHS